MPTETEPVSLSETSADDEPDRQESLEASGLDRQESDDTSDAVEESDASWSAEASVAVADSLVIRRVDLKEVYLDPANTNTHNPRNLQALVASLREFGQVEPLVVQKGTGKVIGGNGRLEAMLFLGWTHCDVVEIEANSVRSAALGIALNRTAKLSTFDDESLARTLAAIQAEGFPIEAAGFDDTELSQLLERIGGEVVDDPQGEWDGMPEYKNEDKEAFQTVLVNFRCKEDVDSFALLVGQSVSEKTKWIWYPKAEREDNAHRSYSAEISDIHPVEGAI